MSVELIVGLLAITAVASIFVVLPLMLSTKIADASGELPKLQKRFSLLQSELTSGAIDQATFDQRTMVLEDRVIELGLVGHAPKTKPLLLITWLVIFLSFSGYVIYEETGDSHVDTLIAFHEQANQKITRENAPRFIELQQQHLWVNDKDVLGWSQLANAYAMLGDHAEAIAAGKKAVELSNRQNPIALLSYAEALIVSEHPAAIEQAKAELEHTITIDPAYIPPYFALGYIERQSPNRKNQEKALSYWKRVANSPYTSLRTASFMEDFLDLWIVVNDRDLGGAAQYIDQALLLDPDKTSFKLLRMQAAMSNQNYRLAHRYFQRSLTTDAQKDSKQAKMLANLMLKQFDIDRGPVELTLSVSTKEAVAKEAKDTYALIVVTAQRGSKMPLAVCSLAIAELPRKVKIDQSFAMNGLYGLNDFDDWEVAVNVTTAQNSWTGNVLLNSDNYESGIEIVTKQDRSPLPIPRKPKPCRG